MLGQRRRKQSIIIPFKPELTIVIFTKPRTAAQLILEL